MSRTIDCIYCGQKGRQGKEHLVPRWLWKELSKVGHFVAPARGRHLFGGNQTIPDVCVDCNSGPLSQLDESAKSWWVRRGESLDPILNAHPPTIGRWCAKIAVNMERAEAEQNRVGTWTPQIPLSVKRWVIVGGPAPRDLAIRAAALPATHHFALDGGIYGSGDRTLGARVLQLLGVMFYVVWHFPLDPVSKSIALTHAYLDRYHPSVQLDLTNGTGPIDLPLVPNPDELTLGVYDDPILVAKVRVQLEKQDAPEGAVSR